MPLNTSALPYLPEFVQVAPLIVPLFPFPEASATVVPVPSLNPYAATGVIEPSGTGGVAAVATAANSLKLPAASSARTR